MSGYMDVSTFWHAFLPLFVALDGVGLLPLYWGLTRRLSAAQRRQAVGEAVVTALLVALSFLLVSRFVFALMGLAVSDVMIAGGAILIVLCLRELIAPASAPAADRPSPGVVPLGVPLLCGPAVLATVLLVRDQHGWAITLIALLANLAAVWGILRSADWLMDRLGTYGAEVISKIANLILTAYGVMLIRQGLTALLAAHAAEYP